MDRTPHAFDDLPVVSPMGEVAANSAPARTLTLGDLVAAISDEAESIAASEAECDALVAASVFGLQWSLRRVTLPATGATAASSGAAGAAGSDRAA